MGQAKLRGTFEERKAKAIVRNESKRQEWQDKVDARIKRRREEQIPRQRRADQATALELETFYAMATGFGCMDRGIH